jgi:hypothetical protein
MGKNLVYTIALDRPGETGHRNLAKMLVSSLLRTRFSGDIVVFHATPYPLFMVARAGVQEVEVKLPRKLPRGGGFVALAQSFKHEVAARIDTTPYDKVMFIDSDSVVLRNIDHLLEGAWDLAVYGEEKTSILDYVHAFLRDGERERLVGQGYNSGTFAVRASLFRELLRSWQTVENGPPQARVGLREQQAFNRVVLDWTGEIKEWSPRDIALPFCIREHAPHAVYCRAAIVHAASGDHSVDDKLRFLFGLFSSVFLFDTQLSLFNLMEM